MTMDAESQLAAALVELESDAGWSDTSTKDGCVYRTRDGKPGFETTRGLRTSATLAPLPPDWISRCKGKRWGGGTAEPDAVCAPLRDALDFLYWWDDTATLWMRDPMMESVEVLAETEDGGKVVRERAKLPWPLSNREFVSVYYRFEQPDGSTIYTSAPALHSTAPATDAYVRGQASSVTRVRDAEGQPGAVELTMSVWYDMAGSLPRRFMNAMTSMYAAYPNDMRKAVGELGVTAQVVAAGRAAGRDGGEESEGDGVSGASGGAGTAVSASAAASVPPPSVTP